MRDIRAREGVMTPPNDHLPATIQQAEVTSDLRASNVVPAIIADRRRCSGISLDIGVHAPARPETPNSVFVRVQKGKCDLNTVLYDIMGLTKINFNSCLHNDRLPVTIRFPTAVGEIMIAAPQTGEPKVPFKFYI
jgi:hypothetical protein